MNTDIKPPSSPEIEANILGAILTDPEAMLSALELIKTDHFYVEAHKLIWDVLNELSEEEVKIDTITVYERAKKKGTIEEIGGAVYISKLTQNVVSSANIVEHCKIIIEKYIYRGLITISHEAAKKAYEQKEDAFDLIPKVGEDIFNLIELIGSKGADRSMGEELKETFDHLETVFSSPDDRSGGLLSYSMPTFNHFTNGIQEEDLILIKGDMKQGKTSLSQRLGLDFVIHQGVPVAMFNYEMGKRSIYYKNLSMMTGISYKMLRNPKGVRGKDILTSKEFSKMANKAYEMQDILKLFVCDEILERRKLKARMKKLKIKHKIGCFIIDYLQLMPTSQKYETKTLEIADSSRFFKVLAKELRTPIILLSQVNVAGASFLSRGPQMDADFVINVKKPLENDMKTIKNRMGEKFEFDKDHFLVQLEYSRHGENQIQYVTKFINNDFVEIDINKSGMPDVRYEKTETTGPAEEEIF